MQRCGPKEWGQRTTRRLRLVAPIACALALLAASGCQGSGNPEAVSSAARSFVSALEHGDGAAACRLLTADAEKSVSGATDQSCRSAITSITIHGSAVREVQVWSDAAQVHIGDGVLFLRHVDGSWQVSAAGCQAAAQGRYDCAVQA